MPSLADTIERLARLRDRQPGPPEQPMRLSKLEVRGKNPGSLAGWYGMPSASAVAPALVVVLHGCTQTAAGYDRGSGWSGLADDYGFAVLFPEQSRQNNPNLCFNWFVEDDITRGHGEVQSICEMIGTMISVHGVDARRVYITGLSAGGAMANAMLAAYPELFRGGAIIAGLPHGTASTIPEAFDRMRGHGIPPAEVLQAKLRASSGHTGPWPTISVWQGTADRTVAEVNGRAVVDQWRGVHGLGQQPGTTETVDGQNRQVWKDRAGDEAVDLYTIEGMGHGTPVDAATGYGEAGAYMLDVGISSTVHIARNWGLTPSFERRQAETGGASASAAPSSGPAAPGGVRDVIENALRAAGLMK